MSGSNVITSVLEGGTVRTQLHAKPFHLLEGTSTPAEQEVWSVTEQVWTFWKVVSVGRFVIWR